MLKRNISIGLLTLLISFSFYQGGEAQARQRRQQRQQSQQNLQERVRQAIQNAGGGAKAIKVANCESELGRTSTNVFQFTSETWLEGQRRFKIEGDVTDVTAATRMYNAFIRAGESWRWPVCSRRR